MGGGHQGTKHNEASNGQFKDRPSLVGALEARDDERRTAGGRWLERIGLPWDCSGTGRQGRASDLDKAGQGRLGSEMGGWKHVVSAAWEGEHGDMGGRQGGGQVKGAGVSVRHGEPWGGMEGAMEGGRGHPSGEVRKVWVRPPSFWRREGQSQAGAGRRSQSQRAPGAGAPARTGKVQSQRRAGAPADWSAMQRQGAPGKPLPFSLSSRKTVEHASGPTPDQRATSQARPSQAKPAQTRPKQAKPNQSKNRSPCPGLGLGPGLFPAAREGFCSPHHPHPPTINPSLHHPSHSIPLQAHCRPQSAQALAGLAGLVRALSRRRPAVTHARRQVPGPQCSAGPTPADTVPGRLHKSNKTRRSDAAPGATLPRPKHVSRSGPLLLVTKLRGRCSAACCLLVLVCREWCCWDSPKAALTYEVRARPRRFWPSKEATSTKRAWRQWVCCAARRPVRRRHPSVVGPLSDSRLPVIAVGHQRNKQQKRRTGYSVRNTRSPATQPSSQTAQHRQKGPSSAVERVRSGTRRMATQSAKPTSAAAAALACCC